MEEKTVKRLRELEHEISGAVSRLETAKFEAKTAKEELDEALLALRNYVRELTDPNLRPLLNQVDRATGEIRPAGGPTTKPF